jgi:hypothetical protein
MNLVSIHEEIGEALSAIEGLRVLPFDAKSASVPAVLFAVPENFEYGQTYGSPGLTKFDLPITVLVGAVSDRSSRVEVMQYASTEGAKSVKLALESFQYTSCDDVFVSEAEFGAFQLSSVDYLAVTFTVQVFGA